MSKDFTGVPTPHFIIKGSLKDDRASLREVTVDGYIVTPDSFNSVNLRNYAVHQLLRWHDSPDFDGWDFIKEKYLASFDNYEDAAMFAGIKCKEYMEKTEDVL